MMVIIILFLVGSLDVSVLISTFVPLFAMNIDKCDTVLFMRIISIFKSGCHKSTFHAFSHIEFMFAEHIVSQASRQSIGNVVNITPTNFTFPASVSGIQFRLT